MHTYCTEPTEIARLCGIISVAGESRFTNRVRQPLRRQSKTGEGKIATVVRSSGVANPGGVRTVSGVEASKEVGSLVAVENGSGS